MREVDGSEQPAAQADSREACSRRIGHCVREFSSCVDEPVAEIVPNTQPIAQFKSRISFASIAGTARVWLTPHRTPGS
jgi:hypothetical protein